MNCPVCGHEMTEVTTEVMFTAWMCGYCTYYAWELKGMEREVDE